MRTEGADFLQKNVTLTEEVRRTFADIDRIEKELGRASKAIQSASELVIKIPGRLQELCDNAAGTKDGPETTRHRGIPPHICRGEDTDKTKPMMEIGASGPSCLELFRP
jgi:hypothetical protein